MIRMNYNTKHPYRYGFVVDIQLAPHSSDDAPLDDTQTQSELHLPVSGLMTIGGEQRAAHFLVLPTPQKHTTSVTGERSLLYMATPATFETGWKPSRRFEPLDKPLAAAINTVMSRLVVGNSIQATRKAKTRRCNVVYLQARLLL